METPSLRVTREDLLLFVNACFACNGQREFYGDGYGQRVSLGFLHEYILGNYRALYARVLACGVNHANQALIIQNLLATGKLTAPAARAEENALVTRALRELPPHRAMHLLEALAARGMNNRRTRALTAQFLALPEHRDFRAVKYRRAYWRATRHAHVPLAGELATFFTRGWKSRRFETPLFESFRQAHFAEKAIYELPFTVAEGLAAKHRVPRAVFLERIAPRMTAHERMRLHDASRAAGVPVVVDWAKQPLTRIASYVLSLPCAERVARRDEIETMLQRSVARIIRRTGARFERVACVLDRSYSSRGSRDKPNRPLAVAWAVARFFAACSASLATFWSHATSDEMNLYPTGTTDLVTPLLAALREQPELVVIVSDGFDNDPQGLAGAVCTAAARLWPGTFMIHLNPVYDRQAFAPKSLSPSLPALGIRDADDVPTLLAFARFAHGEATMRDLSAALDTRVAAFLAVA